MPPRRKLTKGGVVAAVWAGLLVPVAVYAANLTTSLTDVVTVLDQVAVNVLHTFDAPAGDTVGVVDQVGINMLYTYQAPQNDGVGIAESVAVSFVLRTTTTTLTSTANPSTYGAPITLTATIVASTNPGTGDGTVDFKEGTTVLCAAVPLTGNTATCIAKPNAGSHAFTSAYSGTSRYAASSGALTQQVNRASLTVTANAISRAYGAGNPSFTSTISGFVNGETLITSGVTGSPSCTTPAVPASAVGGYPINCTLGSLAATNYTFGFTAGTLAVTQAGLTVTADSQSRPYGASNPALTGSITGFVNGQTLATSGVAGSPSCTTTAAPASPAGTYTITCGIGSLASSNYGFSFAPGTLTVTQAGLRVTADAKSRPYGAANPPLTVTITGFVNGESLGTSGVTGSPSCSTPAVPTSPVSGSPYSITCKTGSLASANYNFSFVPGNLTVFRADQRITFPPLPDQLFGAPAFNVGATSDSGLPVTFTAAGQCTVAGSTITITGGGTCSITAIQAGDGNYNPAPSVTRSFNVPCFASRMVFGLPGTLGTVAPSTLIFTNQQPVAGGGCSGTFALTISIGPYTIPVGSGTFTATTSGTVATARLVGTLAPPVSFYAALTLNTATQTGTITEVFATEDGPVTITVTFAQSAGVYVITGATATP